MTDLTKLSDDELLRYYEYDSETYDDQTYNFAKKEILRRLAGILKWRPISEVPKKGLRPEESQDVLFFWPEDRNRRHPNQMICVGRVFEDDYWEADDPYAGDLLDEMNIKPTHWMPLPTSPTEKD